MNYPKITRIVRITKENPEVKTIYFENDEKAKPGQFFMIWIPGNDEIPMSVSFIDKKIKGITFKKVGDATKSLFNLKEGQKIGIRGPFGNGFKIKGKKILFIAGGTGIATITAAVEEAIRNNISSTVIFGVKTKNELFFEERIKKLGTEILISTDDGSKGYKGYATDLAKQTLKEQKFDQIITCGPEIMMKKLFDLSKNISLQASLERFMKCGMGLCGQCTVGNGLRVCVEGPVFDKNVLKDIEDFGKFKRDASGRKVKF